MTYSGEYLVNLILPKPIYKWALSNCNENTSIQTFIIKLLEKEMNQSDNSRYIKDYTDEQSGKPDKERKQA